MIDLVYVMGPSGAGKDTLIDYARARVDPRQIAFATRYITRPADDKGEHHIPLTEAEFAARREAGLFTMSWESHGFFYGIGAEVDLWRERGLLVVVSGARSHWARVHDRYPAARAILVSAPPEVLGARLAARARESEAAIRARLARSVPATWAGDVRFLENSGAIEVAGEMFVSILLQWRSSRWA